jgi:hypothetical protein
MMAMNKYSPRILLAALIALSLCAHADNSAQTIVHMLDYVSVDYPEFVQDGKVLDEAEYKEQLEFATQAAVLLAKLPAVPEQAALLHMLVRFPMVDCRTMADSITAHLNFVAADQRLPDPVRLAATQSVGEWEAMIAMRAVLDRQHRLPS